MECFAKLVVAFAITILIVALAVVFMLMVEYTPYIFIILIFAIIMFAVYKILD